jgi:hypothetical protein
MVIFCRSQWSRGPRRRCTAARLLRTWVRIPTGAWIFVVCVVCCQVEVSATSISLVEEDFYSLWPVIVCDQETSCDEEAKKRRAEPLGNACSINQLSNLEQNKITC